MADTADKTVPNIQGRETAESTSSSDLLRALPAATLTTENTPALTISKTGDETLAVSVPSNPPLPVSVLATSTGDLNSMKSTTESASIGCKVPTVLKFSIENILRPEFGVAEAASGKNRRQRCGSLGSPDGSLSSSSSPTGTASSLNSPTTPADAAASNNAASSTATAPLLWPAWVYCTRYSDRPSSGPRKRKAPAKETKNKKNGKAEDSLGDSSSKPAKKAKPTGPAITLSEDDDDKRPRTAFTPEQLARLKKEFTENRYLTEKRRIHLSRDLDLNESQIKIWFQNKRAKIKKQTGGRSELAFHLMSQGLYNHSGGTSSDNRSSLCSPSSDGNANDEFDGQSDGEDNNDS